MNDAPRYPAATIVEALAGLWRLRPPGPENLLSSQEFIWLRDACLKEYGVAGFDATLALSAALRCFGLPCNLPSGFAHLALSVETAAMELDRAFVATRTCRLHLAPLDLAEDVPSHSFGPARVGLIDRDELCRLVDAERLGRVFHGATFDADRFAQFHWLIVEEVVSVPGNPGARAVPLLYSDLSKDTGRIEPHKGRFPEAFEDALFFLVLMPWEEWSTMPRVDWRGFRIPWVHTVDTDVFVRPARPPSPDTLNWEDCIYDDGYGGTEEVERPLALRLEEAAAGGLSALNEERWSLVERARRSVLFETPIAHFLVRAFLADGIDEVLAHITTIEAALGLRSDHCRAPRPKSDRFRDWGATKRMKGRVSGLLGDRCRGEEYGRLFDLRSAFLHGRVMTPISTDQRILARSLARSVVCALIEATRDDVVSREIFLEGLLEYGAGI